jgi:hypothetical protein
VRNPIKTHAGKSFIPIDSLQHIYVLLMPCWLTSFTGKRGRKALGVMNIANLLGARNHTTRAQLDRRNAGRMLGDCTAHLYGVCAALQSRAGRVSVSPGRGLRSDSVRVLAGLGGVASGVPEPGLLFLSAAFSFHSERSAGLGGARLLRDQRVAGEPAFLARAAHLAGSPNAADIDGAALRVEPQHAAHQPASGARARN